MERTNKTIERITLIGILLLCVLTVCLDFVKIEYVQDPLRNSLLSKIIQQTCGSLAGILLMYRANIRLFGKPQNLLFMIPCLLIAVDNFQFSSYFNGNMALIEKQSIDIILFALYCMAIGLFEECIFRGIIFAVLASRFSNDKKGFLKTYVVSSLIFGLAHLFNGISAATLLQVGYTTLTGGLFAFALIKTKNILCAAFTHGVYNFCGLLFEKFNPEIGMIGLGSGVVFDMGTVLTMLIVSVVVGAFVLYKVFTYTEAERNYLYAKLGVKVQTKEEN